MNFIPYNDSEEDPSVLGTLGLDIADEDYRALLHAARMRLLICLVLFVIFLVGLGWFTQGTAA